jgi:DNA repair ATPase RecN
MSDTTNAGPVLPERPSIRGFCSWDTAYLQNKFDAYGLQCWNACDEQVAGPLRERVAELESKLSRVLDGCPEDAIEKGLSIRSVSDYYSSIIDECSKTAQDALIKKHHAVNELARLRADYDEACDEADKLRQRIAELERDVQSHCVSAKQDADSWQLALAELDARGSELDRLRAENEALSECLRECADDLESEINARAGGDLPRRIERDLEPVRKARELLAARAAREGEAC